MQASDKLSQQRGLFETANRKFRSIDIEISKSRVEALQTLANLDLSCPMYIGSIQG